MGRVKLEETVTANIVGCARCHGPGHDQLEFQAFLHPVVEDGGLVLTHWATCPITKEPILMALMIKEDE